MNGNLGRRIGILALAGISLAAGYFWAQWTNDSHTTRGGTLSYAAPADETATAREADRIFGSLMKPAPPTATPASAPSPATPPLAASPANPAPVAAAPAAALGAPDAAVARQQVLLQSRRTALVNAAERAAPAVVSVGAERTAYVPVPGTDMFEDLFFGPPILYQKIQRKTPYLGSGVSMDREGHIVTNYHVVEGASRLFVTLADKEEYEAELVDADEIYDVAILKLLKLKPEDKRPAPRLRPAALGDSDTIMLGEWVLAIGNPYGGVLEDPNPTVTAGVVSAKNRRFRASDGQSFRVYEGMIQTDASINPGNSGGALVNALGEAIGINTFILSESGGSIGIGFAIPINRVKRMMDEIRQYGRLRKAALDFVPVPITPHVQRALSLPASQGVLIYRMETGGPAQGAGLRPGDVITAINGVATPSLDEFRERMLRLKVGEELTFKILRGDGALDVKYRVPERANR
jgi:serine protease Do